MASAQEAAKLLRLTVGETLAWEDSCQLHVERRRKRKQLGGLRHALVKWGELVSAAMIR